MIDRFIWGVVHRRKAVVAVLAAVTVFASCFMPFVGTNYNMVDYLPPSAQSTTAVKIMSDDFDQALPNANVMVRDITVPEALDLKDRIAAVEGVESVMWLDDVADTRQPFETLDPALVDTYYKLSEGTGKGVALFQVAVAETYERHAIGEIRALVDSLGDHNAVSGDASDTAQMQAATVEQVLIASAIVVPLIVLLLVLSTMSWIEPLLFLLAIGVSILINMGTNVIFGEVSFITFSVSPILQLAVSLDYAVFLIHAFQAERQKTDDVEMAMARAMRTSAATIAASAVTTLFGFGTLAFMQFQIGADLGLNLVKGICLSFITVVVFLPAVTLMLYKLIDRTQHRRLMPTFENIGKPLSKIRIPALILVLALVGPAFLGQLHTGFVYSNGIPDTTLRSGADTVAVQEEFGNQNCAVVLVPRGDVAREKELSEALSEVPQVTTVVSFARTVGSSIPSEFLDESILSNFYSDDWARIIAYVDMEIESKESFAVVQQMQDIAAQYYDEWYMAGQSANLYDMSQVVSVDNRVVTGVCVIAILLVLLITFRSLVLPFVLVLTIEAGIWINLCIPYYTGVDLNFIGYLVINTVQLGATIDYGILLTSHYLDWRKRLPAREAAHKALGETFRSLVVSAGVLSAAGLALSIASDMSAVCTLGLLLARGALLSLALVTIFLPALLIYLDGPIRVTTWRAGFYRGKALPACAIGVVPASGPDGEMGMETQAEEVPHDTAQ